MKPEVRIYPDAEKMSVAAAEGVVNIMNQVLATDDYVSLVLSGGTTPQRFYQILASPDFINRIEWGRVMLFWGDERYVPQRDRRSNFRMFHEALLHHVNLPLHNIHPMPTHRKDPDMAARDYETFLRAKSEHDVPHFDVMMLGLGVDGHTASLFPNTPALDEKQRWVVANEAPIEPYTRLTMTLPVINAARNVCFLAAGEAKAEVLARVVAGEGDYRSYPASAVHPEAGRLIWWVDEAAAARLDASTVPDVDIEHFDGGAES